MWESLPATTSALRPKPMKRSAQAIMPRMGGPESLDEKDVPETAWVLARAFRDNPGMLAILPGTTEEERLRKLGPCMDGFTRSVLRYGFVEVVKEEGKVVAAALSFRPGEFPPPFYATVIQAKGPLLAGLST